MLSLRVRRTRRSGVLGDWLARYLVSRCLPTLERYHGEERVHLYASRRAWQTLQIERLATSMAEAIQDLGTHLGSLVSCPTSIYLLDPWQGPDGGRLVQGFQWGILADSSAIVYSPTPQSLYSAIVREAVSIALSRAFGNYFFVRGGLAEYLARREEESLYYDVAAIMDNYPLYSWDDLLEGYAPLAGVGSFAHFLIDRFGWEVWRRIHEEIRATRRGISPLFMALPERGWLLRRATGHPASELKKQWAEFVHLHCEHLVPQQRQAYVDRLVIRHLYEERALPECLHACIRYLSAYGSDVEVVFYAVASSLHLGDYAIGIEVLSSHVDALPQWHRAWGYLRLGQLYDAVGDRALALRCYASAMNLSDPWGVLESEAKRYVDHPFPRSHGRVQGDDWLHLQQWMHRACNDSASALCWRQHEPFCFLSLYYSMAD